MANAAGSSNPLHPRQARLSSPLRVGLTGLGGFDAAVAEVGGAPGTDRVVRAAIRPLRGGGAGVPRGAGGAAACGPEGAQDAAARAQPGLVVAAAAGLQDGDVALPARSRGAVHETIRWSGTCGS